ncbi:MAG: F0F1 ATP synthase subunit alpha [Clostridia bacterium]|nr:F0F1 ATP synthase subunit alpha [Clostridia bacterium]
MRGINEMELGVDEFQLGRVISVSDGICWMDGLADIMYGEVVEFECGERGMVLDIQPDRIGCVIYGRYEHIEAGSRVRRVGRIASVYVGEELLGRVVDPLGHPLDGKGHVFSTKRRPIECAAPAITDRSAVSRPLHTGLKAIDSMVPIGRGQRELIIGDRQIGKTSIIIDTILNQKDKGIPCIYVAIGQKDTTVAEIYEKLTRFGAMKYTTIVCAPAASSASLQYIAPFAGAAIGEYFMYSGKDALIIYDDLSKHAVAYRELSLLLHRPSGREAYPGDVFYLHSRLLERAAQLSPERGGGSLTALPVIETQAGDISAYIPTNVISITDGQIFLDSDLFNEGQRPAVNVGLSVSRVGGAAQTKLMKQVASRLRMDLAQYRELANFAQFGSDIDESTKKVLASGERMMYALRQNKLEPLPDWKQALIIFAAADSSVENITADRMADFEKAIYEYAEKRRTDIVNLLKTGKKLDSKGIAALHGFVAEFTSSFSTAADVSEVR